MENNHKFEPFLYICIILLNENIKTCYLGKAEAFYFDT
jgi:hypothetical protein